MMEEFSKYLEKARIDFSTGSIDIKLPVEKLCNKDYLEPTVIMTPAAYLKMLTFVESSNEECAWHGTVVRDKENNIFHIDDVFMFPQTVTGSTVRAVDGAFEKWSNSISDEKYNTIRFQGHSHVNFTATPSAVDRDYYNDMLQAFKDTDFYIFCIMNKKRDIYWLIYDLEQNIMYEPADIEFVVGSEEEDILMEAQMQYKENITAYKKPVVIPGISTNSYVSKKEDDKSSQTRLHENLYGSKEKDPFYVSDRYPSYFGY